MKICPEAAIHTKKRKVAVDDQGIKNPKKMGLPGFINEYILQYASLMKPC